MDHGKLEWKVFLLGGASGTGKTSISYRLARHFGVGITEVDDFQIVLRDMTTAKEHPTLHKCWSREADKLPVVEIVDLQIAVSEIMMPVLEAVITNHIDTNTPLILEGDYIHPRLVSLFRGDLVRALILHEPEESQLLRNFASREPKSESQYKRAQVSRYYSQWLKAEAGRYGVPVVESRPWETVFERAAAVLGRPQAPIE